MSAPVKAVSLEGVDGSLAAVLSPQHTAAACRPSPAGPGVPVMCSFRDNTVAVACRTMEQADGSVSALCIFPPRPSCAPASDTGFGTCDFSAVATKPAAVGGDATPGTGGLAP